MLDQKIGQMDDSLQSVSGKTLPQTSDHLDGFSKHAAQSHEHLRMLHVATRLFGGQLGEMGHLLHAAVMGFGELAVAMYVIKQIMEQFKMAKETVVEFNAEVSKIKQSGLDAAFQAARDFRSEISGARDAVEQMNTKYREGETLMQNRLKLYGLELDAELKIAEAKAKTREMEIDAQYQNGMYTKEQADAMKETLELQMAQLKGRNDLAKLAEEIAQREHRQREATGRLESGKDKAAELAAEKEVAAADAVAGRSKAAVPHESVLVTGGGTLGQDARFKNVGEVTAAISDQKDKIEDYKKSIIGLQGTYASLAQAELANMEKRLTALTEVETHEKSRIKLATDLAQRDEEAVKTAKIKLQTALDRTKTDEESKTKGQDEINLLKEQYEIQRKTTVEVLQQGIAQSQMKVAAENLTRFKELAEKGGGLTARESKELAGLLPQIPRDKKTGLMFPTDIEEEGKVIEGLRRHAIGAAMGERNAGIKSNASLDDIAEALQQITALQNSHILISQQQKTVIDNVKRLTELNSRQIENMRATY